MQKSRATLHGSMRKYYDSFITVNDIFTKAGINIIAPKISEILSGQDDFVYSIGDDIRKSPVEIESEFLSLTASLDHQKDFAYVINPEGYVGKSASAEIAFLLSQRKRVFAMEEISDPPLLLPDNYIHAPEELVQYYQATGEYPFPKDIVQPTREIIKNTIYPLPAVGGIVVDKSSKAYLFGKRKEKNIGLVKRSGWGDRYTILGGTKLPGENDIQRLKKEFQEQLGIVEFSLGGIITSFLEIKNSGYRNTNISREFKDYITGINHPIPHPNRIRLPPSEAIRESHMIEPNAMKTIKRYAMI